MKILSRIIIAFFAISSAQDLNAQLKDEVGHTVTQWSNWSTTECHRGIAWRLRQNYYSGDNNGYTWEYEVKNNYGRQVAFSYEFSESETSTGNNRMRKTLSPNQVYRNTALPNSSRMNYFVFSVCFSNDGRCKDECYSPCDNGTPNIPDCATSNTTTSNSQTTTTSSNNQSRQTTTYAPPQPTKSQKQAEALNQVSNSLMDLARALDAAKEEKRIKREEERLAQIKLQNEREQLQRVKEQEAAIASEELNGEWKRAKEYSNSESPDGYRSAIQIMLPYAINKRLNGMAVNTIGFWYWKIEDYTNAMKWYTQAYIDGNTTAKYNIGILYLNGMGVSKNKGLALSYFQKACLDKYENGCTKFKNTREELELDAIKNNNNLTYNDLYNLAESYYIENNFSQTLKFFTQGYIIDTTSNWNIPLKIADIYFNKEQLYNEDSAARWYHAAISLMENDINQKSNIGKLNTFDNTYRRVLFRYADIIRNTNGKLAIDTYLKAVRDKLVGAYYRFDGGLYIGAYTEIGTIYELGQGGIEKDWKQAQIYYEKDAERLGGLAMNHLGQLFETGGPNLEKDNRASKKWYKMACKTDKKYCK